MESGEQHSSVDGLASMPTGPQLCTRLAAIELHDVEDEQLLAMLNAQNRQLAFQQAQTWATMAEVARRDPRPWAVPRLTAEQIVDSAADEIRAELLLTRRGALRELEHAVLVCAQPRVFTALEQGGLDRARAIVLAEGVADLLPEQSERLLDTLLPEADRRTVTGLAERVRRVAVALDPAWAERRYRQAVHERRVIGYLNDDGTATVSGQYLPAEQAAAACGRVDALADAAKRAGAHAPIDHLRVELFLALLDGRYQNLTPEQIITALCAQFPTHTTPGTADGETTQRNNDATERNVAAAAADADCAAAPSSTRGVALTVGLATLLGLDEQPGELPGWGPVTASVARAVAARHHGAQWRFAILDDDGRLLTDGTTRHRPRALRDPVQAEGGIVELHLPATLLDDPDLAQHHPAWATLLTDLARQHADPRPLEQDPHARFPGRRLRRRSQLTFQRCVFAGCRRPATACDQDHRHDHAQGGKTEEANLAPACRHDHTNKTQHGWRLVRIDPHTYRWISPLGRKHTVLIDPIAAPLPAPIPRPPRPTIDPSDSDDPERTFRALTQRGRALTAPAPRAAEANHDPPPF